MNGNVFLKNFRPGIVSENSVSVFIIELYRQVLCFFTLE